MKIMRKLYDWVLHWADTPYGPAALIVLSFAEASFFPIPPDVLLIALALGARKRSLIFALYCSLASVAGAIFGYTIGHFLWWDQSSQFSGVAQFFFSNIPGFTTDLFYQIQGMYEEWNFWIIFTAGFTPIPFKVFTISAGAFDINFVMFIISGLVSRSARFFLVAWLIYKFGEPIREFIDKYFNWLALAFTILLVGGFYIIKYLI
jgi:membrane protein YqaA with SNARE-associated domain